MVKAKKKTPGKKVEVKKKPVAKAKAKAKPLAKAKVVAKAKPLAKSDLIAKHMAGRALKAQAAKAAATPKPATHKPVAQHATGPKPASAHPGKPAAPAAPVTPKKPSFKVGELIVYPAHGVGKITNIEEQEIAGAKLELYIVDFEKEKLRLKVPTNRAEQKGMRHLADRTMIEQAMKVIRGRPRIKRVMWSRRAQEYDAKINSGDLIAVSEVVRDLYRSERQPEQSYSERQLFEQALARFARELAAVRKIDDDQCIKELEDFLARNAKRTAVEKPDEETAEEAA
jgi:CarD family transcriptional regulator